MMVTIHNNYAAAAVQQQKIKIASRSGSGTTYVYYTYTPDGPTGRSDRPHVTQGSKRNQPATTGVLSLYAVERRRRRTYARWLLIGSAAVAAALRSSGRFRPPEPVRAG
jgi:hypothetical protein